MLAGAHGALHWSVAIFYLLLPFIKAGFELSYAETGLLASIVHLSAFVANFPSGIVVDVTGRRTACQLTALLLAGVALVGIGWAPSYWVLASAAALIAMMNTLWHPAAISFLSDSYPMRRGMALSFHTVGASLGDAAAPAVAGLMIASFGWHDTAMLGAAVPVLAALVVFHVFVSSAGRNGTARSQASGSAAYFGGLRQLVGDPTVWKVCVMAGFRGTGQAGLRTFLPLYFFATFTDDPFWLGIVLMTLQISGAIATPFAGTLSDRIGRRPILMAGFVASALIVLALPSVASLPAFIVLVALAGVAIFAVRPVIQSWAMEKAPAKLGGSMVSLLFGTQSAFAMAVPIVGGLIADNWGIAYVFYLLAAAIVVAIAIALTIADEARS